MADSLGKLKEDDEAPCSGNDEVPGSIKGILCQSCKDKQTVAEKFCLDCNEHQCTECIKVHYVLSILKTHKFVNADTDVMKQRSFDIKGLERCNQHKKLIKFFCEDENQLCCSTCAIVDHRKCDSVVEVQKLAGNLMSQNSFVKEKLLAIKEKAEGIIEQIISSKEKLDQDVNRIPETIKQVRDEVIRMFEDLEVSIVKRAKTFQAESHTKLTKRQTRTENYLSDVRTRLETIESIYRNGSSAQQFIVEHVMENDVKTLYTNVSEEYQNLETASASFQFDETINLPPLPITEYVPGQLTLQFLRQGDISAVMSLTPVSSVDLKKTGDDINEPLYTGIDVLPDGRVVAVDNENKKCLVYNEKLEKVGSCQLSYVPQSVVAVTEEEVAITSGSDYRVEFFKVRKSNEIISIRKCEVKTKYDSICLKDNRQFIVGTIDYQRPVRILSLTGEEKDFSMMFSNKTYSLDTNACTYIRSIDKVVIAERYEHTVYIYDVKTNMKVEVKDDRILNPCGVAVGPSDTIFVCSNGTDSIVQISQTGQILSSHKIDMDLPYKACVSRDKSFLVVTNSCIGDLKLKKFKIS